MQPAPAPTHTDRPVAMDPDPMEPDLVHIRRWIGHGSPIPGETIATGAAAAGMRALAERCVEAGLSVHQADLRLAPLAGARLAGARLQDAELERAHMTGADLRGADLTGANLRGARLCGADLTGARLDHARTEGADLTGARGILRLPVGDPVGFDCIAVRAADGRGVRIHAAGLPAFGDPKELLFALRPDSPLRHRLPPDTHPMYRAALAWLARQWPDIPDRYPDRYPDLQVDPHVPASDPGPEKDRR